MNHATDEPGDEPAFPLAFVMFYTETFGEIERYIHRRFPTVDAAEMTSETFMRLLRRWHLLSESPRSYAYRTATNLVMDEYRRQRREVATEPIDLIDVGRMVREWFPVGRAHILSAVESLPKRLREAITLHLLGWSVTEIAEVQEVTVATVSDYLNDARDRIYEHLYACRRGRTRRGRRDHDTGSPSTARWPRRIGPADPTEDKE